LYNNSTCEQSAHLVRARSVPRRSGIGESFKRQLPRSFSQPNVVLEGFYDVNRRWKTVLRRGAATVYLAFFWIWMFSICEPHITFFKYLTNWG